MGGFGWSNPFPFEFGGGSTHVATIYAAMRSAVGVGGSALDDDGTIDGLWRQARASGLAAVATTGERAIIQAFPGHATDLLDYYELLLGATPEPDASLIERQLVVEQLWTERVSASVPDLGADLARIDPRFSIIAVSHTEATETVLGRAFEDLAGTLPFGGGRASTAFHNYSTEFVVYVLFDIGSGVTPGTAEQKLIERAKSHLNKMLPAHVTFQIVASLGFILDTDLLDLTGLTP